MDKNGAQPLETISWIHLSDLHLTQEKLPAEKDCILKKLFLDIKKREQISPDLKNIDMIFITGDITQSGSGTEFEVFDSEVLSNILVSLGLDPVKDKNKVFMVPGNHDVDRDKLNDLFPRDIKTTKEVKNILENEAELSKYLERQKAYFEYFKKISNKNILTDNHIYAKDIDNSKYKIMILGFNSSWCAGEYFKKESDMKLEDFVIFGRSQLLRLVKDIDTSEYMIISLLHHDLHSFKSFDGQEDAIESLEEESDFILHGHKHKLRSDNYDYSNVYTISAGTTDTKDNIGYNYVVVNPSKKSITVHHRIYNKSGLKFEKDKTLKDKKFNEKLKSKKFIRNKDSFTNESDNNESQKEYLEDIKLKLSQEEKAEFKSLMSNGLGFLSTKKYKQAVKCFESAKKIDPKNENVYIANGLLKYELGYYDLAIEDLEKSIKINPKIPFAYLLKGFIRRDLNQPKQAIKDLDEAIKHNPNEFSLYKQRGNLKYNLGNRENNKIYLEDSVEDYTNAIRLHNKDAESYFNKGNANYLIGKLIKEDNYFEKAIKDYTEAIRLNPKSIRAYGQRGNAKSKLYQYESAIGDYEEVIRLDPKDSQAYNGRGIVEIKMGHYKEAMQDFDMAIEIDPKNAEAYNNRGIAHYYNNNYKNANEDFNKAIYFDPKDSIAYYCRGRLFLVLGLTKEGFDDCDKAIALNEKQPVAYLNRSIANLLLGNNVESRKDYEKAVQLANEQNNEQAKKEIAKCFDKDGNLLPNWNVPKRDESSS